MNIAEWLEAAGFLEFVETFQENGIDYEVLPDLTDSDLKELGVVRLGDRKKLLKAITALQQGSGESSQATLAPASTQKSSASPTRSSNLNPGTLPSPSVPGGPSLVKNAENRQLTVMFCDLAGSTELSTLLGAEQYREIIRDFQRACGQAVQQHQGFIARYMGDGILVYFGYPQASEDDVDRAVLAALAVIEATQKISQEVRIGLATGRVIVGDLVGEGPAEERTVVGEPPNLAARLQGLAKTNTVVVSQVTRQLTQNRFLYKDLGTHHLKGFEQPVPVWRLLSPKPVESRFAGSHNKQGISVVGRDTEKALLLNRWQMAVGGEGQTVFISGEAGIGKSSLIEAVLQDIPDKDRTVIRYQCSPHHSESALYPVIQQILFAASIQPADNDTVRLNKIEKLFIRSGANNSETRLVAHLLDIAYEDRYGRLNDSAQTIKSDTLELLMSQLFGLSARRPVLLMFEDLHWIDPSTLALLESSMESLKDYRVLIVATHRPEWQPNHTGYTGFTSLQLNRLGKSAGMMLVRNLVGEFVGEEALERIVSRTDGIPLFIEEVSKAVVESAFDSENVIPETLHASLLARFDRLDDVSRSVALTASAIGREFGFNLVVAASNRSQREVNAALGRLIKAGLVTRQGNMSKPLYSFKHALVQEVIYDTMLSSVRHTEHKRIVEAMQNKSANVAHVSPELLARHYYESGNSEYAAQQWHIAGLRYAAMSSNTEAVSQMQRGIDALRKIPCSQSATDLLVQLHISMTGPLVASRGFTSTVTTGHIEQSLELVRQTGETGKIFPILYGRYIAHALGGKVTDALQFAAEFLSLAEQDKDAELEILGRRILGQAMLFAGKPGTAEAQLLESLAIVVEPGQEYAPFHFGHDIQTAPMCYLSWVCSYSGRPAEAIDWAERALQRAHEIGHANTIGYVLLHNALTYVWSELDVRLSNTITEWKLFDAEHEVPAWRPFFRVVDCLMLKLESSAELIDSIAACEAANTGLGLVFVLPQLKAMQALVYVKTGQFELAEVAINRGIELTGAGEVFHLPCLLLARALWLQAKQEGSILVCSAFDDALAMSQELGAAIYEQDIVHDYAKFLITIDQRSRACYLLQALVARFGDCAMSTRGAVTERLLASYSGTDE